MPWSHLALVGDRLLATMSSTNTFAPGNVVVVRDEEWLVTSVDESSDGAVLNAQGLSDLVRGHDAVFYPSLDRITLNDPRELGAQVGEVARVVAAAALRTGRTARHRSSRRSRAAEPDRL
ncbi:hypothetical protein BW733_16625 [Tessaracoccus flavescens]|uniref:Uncharacterized protein n=2 Tax=Tessaracoccus flavescens TaxID=399497 RepID=A0A1Q2D1H2_9ACTN|nr:hypothetical protein BW733_16625 [Tessaracoccus flavescens]